MIRVLIEMTRACAICGEVACEADLWWIEDDDDVAGIEPGEVICSDCAGKEDHEDAEEVTLADGNPSPCCGHDLEHEPAEPYEWWAVDSWFAERLEDRGCVVLDDVFGVGPVWGRETTGQAIMMDGVVRDIVTATGWGAHNDWGQA